MNGCIFKDNTCQLKSDNRDRRLVPRHGAEQKRCGHVNKALKLQVISSRGGSIHLVTLCDHSEKISVVATMPISTSYVIFHAMALFTVFSVGNQGFEDRGNKTPSLQHASYFLPSSFLFLTSYYFLHHPYQRQHPSYPLDKNVLTLPQSSFTRIPVWLKESLGPDKFDHLTHSRPYDTNNDCELSGMSMSYLTMTPCSQYRTRVELVGGLGS